MEELVEYEVVWYKWEKRKENKNLVGFKWGKEDGKDGEFVVIENFLGFEFLLDCEKVFCSFLNLSLVCYVIVKIIIIKDYF